MSYTPFLLCAIFLIDFYLASSKTNTIVYQIDKCLMVQIWILKFIKSILDVILIYYLMTTYVHLFPLSRCKL